MRIHYQAPPESAAPDTGKSLDAQRVGRGESAGPEAAHGGRGDRVELSSTAARVSRVLSVESGRRASRVQSLAVEYQAGRYQPDAGRIARAMVADAMAEKAG